MDEKRKKKLAWQLPFLLLLVAGTIFIIRQQRNMPYQHNQGGVFGTFYTVTYQYDTDLQAEIEAELKKVDAEFSMFNEQSTVARINRGENPPRSAMFLEVYELAQTVHQETGGAFDITVAPLVNAWGFGFKHTRPQAGDEASDMLMPTARQIDSLLQIRNQLDFSAIAKGYGSDVVSRFLQRKGVKNYMVEIGGEVVTKGVSPNRVPWRIGVTKPTEEPSDSTSAGEGELQTVLNMTDIAMATSGNYRNFYYKGGRKYAHTIDPRTGYPVQHNILSATVLAKECATADAYATAFMVLGLDGACEVLQRHPELKAYLIYTDEKGALAVWQSPEIAPLTTNP